MKYQVSNGDNRIVYRGSDREKAEAIAEKWTRILIDELDNPNTPPQPDNKTRFVWLETLKE